MKQKTELPVANLLSAFRQKRGLSAVELAQAVGVSRQTVYAMEAGDYVPNTTVALKLAKVLQTTVEEMFQLNDAAVTESETQPVAMLPGDTAETCHRVQLCRVDNKLIACGGHAAQWNFAAADGVLAAQNKVQTFHPEHDFKNRLLMAGCDPGMPILSRHLQLAGVELIIAQRNSSQSLKLLAEGSIHAAGTHLRDEQTGEFNLPQIRKHFSANSVAVFAFATWQMGLATASKKIRSIEDLAKPGVSIVNREPGSGARQLLDSELKKTGFSSAKIRGYDRNTDGHLSAAWHVRAGVADACIATEAAARAFDLQFIPLLTERYDLVIRRKHLDLPAMQVLLETLNRLSFRKELNSLGGYDTANTGQRIT